uniref:Gustatory receptor n=1 Tax=Tetranychus urticae TaxID=32264 RepID=T1KRK6_TETUR
MDHLNNEESSSLDGFYTQHKPFSIFGALLVRKSISHQIIFCFTSVLLITKAFCRLYMIFDPTISRVTTADYSFVKYEKTLKQLNSLLVGLVILHFMFNRQLYIRYLNVYYSIAKNNFGLFSTEFVVKWTKFNQLFLTLALIVQLIITLDNYYVHYFNEFGFSLNMIVYSIVVYTAKCIEILAIQFIIECCFYSQSTFLPLIDSLDTLAQSNNRPSQSDINRITKSIRLYYSETIRSIRYMDRYLTYAILVFYSYFIGHCIFLFGTLFYSNQSTYIFFMSVFEFCIKSLYLFLVTYHLIRVNQLSVQMFDKVYDLSYSLNADLSRRSINEINLFLLRIGRNDVGFTLAGLCLVSPSFVSSVATISLTIGLALPNFIK